MEVTRREAEVKLLGSCTSPYVMRVRIALNLKGVQYELTVEQMNNKSQLLLSSNPVYKKVPVLIHNGNCICESMIIIQYIDEVWNSNQPSILPSDPYERAMARFWAVYIDDKLTIAIRILRGMGKEPKEQGIEIATTVLNLLEEAFVKCSKGKSFFGGDTIGYLDIALGSRLGWIEVIQQVSATKLLDSARIPHLCKWSEQFCSHPAVKDVMPALDKLLEYNELAVAKFKAYATQ